MHDIEHRDLGGWAVPGAHGTLGVFVRRAMERPNVVSAECVKVKYVLLNGCSVCHLGK